MKTELEENIARRLAQVRVALRVLLGLTDRGTWVAEGVLGCYYPRTGRAMAVLSRRGVRVLINLHEKAHGTDGCSLSTNDTS